jgi:hypothetical protein
MYPVAISGVLPVSTEECQEIAFQRYKPVLFGSEMYAGVL